MTTGIVIGIVASFTGLLVKPDLVHHHQTPFASSDPAAASAGDELDPVRRLYIRAIYKTVDIDSVERVLQPIVDRTGGPVAHAYQGALTVLRARSAAWPGSKLKYTRRGLAVLDPLVAENPENVEIRFLRLVSCYRLPGILGRRWSVEEDMQVVSARFSELDGSVDDIFYNEVVKFVHDHGQN